MTPQMILNISCLSSPFSLSYPLFHSTLHLIPPHQSPSLSPHNCVFQFLLLGYLPLLNVPYSISDLYRYTDCNTPIKGLKANLYIKETQNICPFGYGLALSEIIFFQLHPSKLINMCHIFTTHSLVDGHLGCPIFGYYESRSNEHS